MKLKKIVLSSVVAIILFLTAVLPAGVASANEEEPAYLDSVSDKKHFIYSKDSDQEGIIAKFDLKNYDDKITIKCSSKNMYAGITYKNSSHDKDGEVESNFKSVAISAIFKKAGNYKVTIIEKTADGKDVFTKNIKVYCNTDKPIKKITFNGKEISSGLVNMKSAKLKVTMNKGYKLKKIEYGVYEKDKDDITWKTKTIKNGGKIVFGKYPYRNAYNSERGDKNSDSYYYNETILEELIATTSVRITYTDKYTKETDTDLYSYYRYLK